MFPHLIEPVQNHSPHRTFRLVVAYDGSDFFGWQVQPGMQTIQGALADAVEKVTGDAVLPQGSGRTDTGVHAEGQVVSLTLSASIPPERLHRALNRRLPAAIRVLSVSDSDPAFHARVGVFYKEYEYRIFMRREPGNPQEYICPPSLSRFVWDCRWPLTLDRMQQAASAFVGTHDFTSFAASDPDRTQRMQVAGTPVSHTRTVYRSWWEQQDRLLIYRVHGNGFLHHMVRNIVGTCVDVGAGRTPPDGIETILQARHRRFAGATAPPQGLHLIKVEYSADPGAALDAREQTPSP